MAEARSNFVAAVQRTVRAALDWRMALLAVLAFGLFFLTAQLPFRYAFQVGIERGPVSDLPFLTGFNGGELVTWDDSWRWSRGEARIEVPGIGQRGVIVAMNVVSHRAQWQPETAPATVELQIGVRSPVAITLRQESAHYQFLVPPEAMQGGVLRIGIATEPWRNVEDNRTELGIAIGRFLTVTTVPAAGIVWPDPGLLVAWPIGIALIWLALRALNFAPRQAFWLTLPLAIGLPLLALLEAPRLSFGNRWFIANGLISIATALVCVAIVPPILRRLKVPVTPPVLRWLLLLIVMTFAIKYGGQLYPYSMPGDLQLHVNRYMLTVFGNVYIPAQHRGLPFPFPSGLYVLIAPFHLTGLSIHFLFELFAGLFEASSILIMYILLARVTGSPRLGLFAAATYALSSAGFMNAWFSFQTQVATQWFSVFLAALLAIRWPQYNHWPTWWGLVVLFILVFLGHIGSFINTAMLGLLIIPVLWWLARDDAERRGVRWLLGAGLAAAAFVGVFYYTAFWDMVVEQITGIATVGLTGVTERAPIPRTTTLRVLWNEGLIIHYGFFPILLAFIGAFLAATGSLRRSILPPLLWLTFFVATFQGLIPLVTLSSITTRWLTFAGWAIAVGCAIGLAYFWRRGRTARLVSLLMLAYVSWLSVIVWIDAMALRLPPIEPF